MSINAYDLIRLPYDDSLTLADAIYVCRTLHFGYNRIGRTSAHRLRRNVATVAAELALRRWLDTENVPYTLIEATPFTRPNYPTLALGDRRLDSRVTFITSRQRIRRVRRNPSWLLEAEAIIPVEQLTSQTLSAGDPYCFIFLIGLETRTIADMRRAISASQPTYLISIPPSRVWRQREVISSLNLLEIRSRDPNPIEPQIVGHQIDHNTQVLRTILYPDTLTKLPTDLTSLTYIHPSRPPLGTISIHSPVLKKTWVVGTHNWANIWIYGQEVILAGWCTKSFFRRHSQFLPEGSRIHLGWRLHEDHRSIPISQLHPIRELAERIRQG